MKAITQNYLDKLDDFTEAATRLLAEHSVYGAEIDRLRAELEASNKRAEDYRSALVDEREESDRRLKDAESANALMERYRDALASTDPYPTDADGDKGPCRFCRRGYWSKHSNTCAWAHAAGEVTTA